MAKDKDGNTIWHEVEPSEQNPYQRLRDLERERILKMTMQQFKDYLNND